MIQYEWCPYEKRRDAERTHRGKDIDREGRQPCTDRRKDYAKTDANEEIVWTAGSHQELAGRAWSC